MMTCSLRNFAIHWKIQFVRFVRFVPGFLRHKSYKLEGLLLHSGYLQDFEQRDVPIENFCCFWRAKARVSRKFLMSQTSCCEVLRTEIEDFVLAAPHCVVESHVIVYLTFSRNPELWFIHNLWRRRKQHVPLCLLLNHSTEVSLVCTVLWGYLYHQFFIRPYLTSRWCNCSEDPTVKYMKTFDPL